NKEAFNYLNKFGENVKKNESNILELKNTIDDAQNSLTKIQNYLDKSTKSVNEVSSYLNSVKGDLPSVTNQINDLQGMVYGNKDLVSSTQVGIQNISNGVKNDLLQMQMVTDKYNGLLNKLNEINSSNVDVKSIDKTIDDMQSALDTLNTIINNSKKTLETINSKYPSNSIQTQIDKLDAMQSFISKDKEQLKSLKSLIDSGKIGESTNNAIKNLTDLNSSFSNNLSSASNNFYNNTLPNLNNIGNTLSKGSDTANSLLESSKAIVPQLNALASFGIASGDLANSQMNTVKTRLDDFKNKVSKIQSETNNITSDSLNEAINTMSKNPEVMASFMSSPIDVKTVDVYDAGIFGVALTPFYTVLGIWVGSLLMLALLTTECEDFEDGEEISVTQKHFGKLLLFLLISVIQTLIVLVGDILVLGVHPVNTGLFMGMGLLS
ncbi:MAG: YhgE/Pip domain-containing protein, partial [Clostridium baratii]|nr:YhgE/Pip domain-containing protein [Clostridium baratii]